MRAIVVGAGDVGYDVARMLSTEQHDVTVIDTRPDKLDAVSARLDVMTLVGSGTSADTLETARVRDAELVRMERVRRIRIVQLPREVEVAPTQREELRPVAEAGPAVGQRRVRKRKVAGGATAAGILDIELLGARPVAVELRHRALDVS